MSDDVQMTVLDIRVELPGNQPLVLLHDPQRDMVVRVWIGAPEASAIAMAQHHVPTPRPMTHQLLVDALDSAGDPLENVRISAVEDSVFLAELVLAGGGKVDSRASDAIACALLADVPVYCAFNVVEEAAVPAEITESADTGEGDELEQLQREQDEQEESMDAFRQFLDQINPDDFADATRPDPHDVEDTEKGDAEEDDGDDDKDEDSGNLDR